MIGILGTGQLGRMTAMAAVDLGYKTRILGPEPGCGFDVATEKMIGKYENPDVIRKFVDGLAVVTTEFENVPVKAVDLIEQLGASGLQFLPGKEALRVAQDRAEEYLIATKLGIPMPKKVIIDKLDDLEIAVSELKFPIVLKKTRQGYDGRGQKTVPDQLGALREAWDELGNARCVAEEKVDFILEFSIITARWQDGACHSYQAFRNRHHGGILTSTLWPDPAIPLSLEQEARQVTEKICGHLDIVGLLCTEWFLTRDGILLNEMAPRPHNSGHVTMDCGYESQFGQLVRAICNLPPGSTDIQCRGEMTNLLGQFPDLESLYNNRNVAVHLYGKEPRQGQLRKIGHFTERLEL